MILYSKSGEFLGIGKEELSFLGYEDLEEFKNTNNDVADLFVNKPGFIFKFKNFSWIDYALHSGAPKKSVILKLKTGNEVETAIKIKELFLNNPKDNEEIYYCIEFANVMTQNNQMSTETSFIKATPTPSSPEHIKIEEDIIKEEKTEEPDAEEEKIEKPNILTSSLDDDFKDDIKEKTSISFDNVAVKEEETPFKLKIDDNSFEEEKDVQTKINITDDYVQEEQKTTIESNYEEDHVSENLPPIKIKLVDEPLQNDIEIDPKNMYEESDVISEKEIEFDLLNCVEELGLDISLVSELLNDYVKQLDKTIPIIQSAIDEKNNELLKNNIYMLKGISDNLNIKQLSNMLVNILNKDNKKEELRKFKQVVENFKGELK